MARLMLAWELGGGLGHAMPLARLAVALLERGHEVHLVWKDLSVSREVLGPWLDAPRLHLWQAPVWQPVLRGLPEPASHAEILFRAGFLDASRLLGLARAWRSLMTAIRPGLLLTDHAPTALLASRGLAMQRALIGTGFFIPPRGSPMPPFRDWEPVPPERPMASEARALATCNSVLDHLGSPRLAALQDLFEADEAFLLGWPELDHLAGIDGDVPRPRAWGALAATPLGAAPAWPAHDGPRIFGYLKGDHPAIEPTLECLRAGPWRSLLHVPGTSAQQVARGASERLRMVEGLVDLPAAFAEADLVLCNANAGTVYAALTAGVPVVMLPMQAEHLLLARRVAAVGAGVYLWPQEAAGGLTRAIEAVLGSPGFRSTAQAVAACNGAEVYGDVLANIIARCEALARAQ